MAPTPGGTHRCPTRVDGADVRFSHAVTNSMCQERQREHYHKCFTCVHKNGYAAPAVSLAAAMSKLPEAPAPARPPAPELVPPPARAAV